MTIEAIYPFRVQGDQNGTTAERLTAEAKGRAMRILGVAEDEFDLTLVFDTGPYGHLYADCTAKRTVEE